MSCKKISQDIGFICLKLVDGSVCRNILAECGKTQRSFVISRTVDVNTGGSETDSSRCFWMHMILSLNSILAVKNDSITVKQNNYVPNAC